MTQSNHTPVASEALAGIEDSIRRKFGFIPAILAEMTASPAVLHAYSSAQDALARGPLTMQEQQAVQTAVSTENGCDYCRSVHASAGLRAGIPADEMKAIATGGMPGDDRLALLVDATRRIMQKRGWLDAADLAEFEAAGLARAELYQIVAYVGVKTISNYINHIAGREIDPQFQAGRDLIGI